MHFAPSDYVLSYSIAAGIDMAQAGNAKQKAFFARRDREARETADAALKAEQTKKATAARVDQARKELARRAELKTDRDRRAAERRKAEAAKREFNRSADHRKAEAARSATERQQQARKRSTDQTAEQRREAAQDLRIERQAMRDVRQQERQAREAMIYRQRQETDELRTRHKGERRSIRGELAGHDADYLDRIERIDQKERRALAAFDDRRGTIRGRLDELRQGKARTDEQRRAIQDGFDQERNDTGRKLEAVKDRAMMREFARPIEQARERMAMMQGHAAERIDQQQRHETARPQAIAARKRSIEQARDRQQEQRQEARRDHAAAPSREFNLAGR